MERQVEQMVRLVPVSGHVLDTCGTGGDDSGSFNISTAAALVACAAGVPVVKHGNRAVSSRSGSADVLRELGVPVEAGADWAQKCLDRVGFAFCYAPHFHRGMAHVSALRRKLGVRTLFKKNAQARGAIDELASSVDGRACLIVSRLDGARVLTIGDATELSSLPVPTRTSQALTMPIDLPEPPSPGLPPANSTVCANAALPARKLSRIA